MWHRATIQSRKQLSPTVTGLTLKIHETSSPSSATTPTNSSFTFFPGQWVDFQPLPTSTSWKPKDSNKTIGGYSITSIPKSLPYIDLAIQSSRHPVAEWVTCHAEVNDLVNLRVGGSFTYDTGEKSDASVKAINYDEAASNETTTKQRLLFVAGGVGINPLFSMIQQWHLDQRENDRGPQSRAVLLYSARQEEDLLFASELNEMVGESSDHFRVVLTTTAPATEHPAGIAASPENDSVGNLKDNIMRNLVYKKGRVDHNMIKDAVRWINMMDNVKVDDNEQKVREEEEDVIADLVYICGPPGMPEEIQSLLFPSQNDRRLVRSTDDVNFEKWW